MFNCIDRDDIYDIVGLYKTECIEKTNLGTNCLENLISALGENSKN